MRHIPLSQCRVEATLRRGRFFFLILSIALSLPALTIDGAEAASRSQADWGRFVTTNPPVAAPEIPFFNARNNPLRLSNFMGRVVLINFWATWCPACITEMPELDRLQSIKGKDGLTVLIIAQNSGPADRVRRFLEDRGIRNLEVYIDHEGIFGQAFGQSMLPTSILIDTKGFEVSRLVGAHAWSSPETVALIDRYLPR